MNEPKTASLTLHAPPNGDGPDGIQMTVDYDNGGDFDPTSNVHNIITHFAKQLVDSSEHLRKVSEEQPRIVLAGGV